MRAFLHRALAPLLLATAGLRHHHRHAWQRADGTAIEATLREAIVNDGDISEQRGDLHAA